jgi:hypothetical protein
VASTATVERCTSFDDDAADVALRGLRKERAGVEPAAADDSTSLRAALDSVLPGGPCAGLNVLEVLPRTECACTLRLSGVLPWRHAAADLEVPTHRRLNGPVRRA